MNKYIIIAMVLCAAGCMTLNRKAPISEEDMEFLTARLLHSRSNSDL
jgi:hypothetical protein